MFSENIESPEECIRSVPLFENLKDVVGPQMFTNFKLSGSFLGDPLCKYLAWISRYANLLCSFLVTQRYRSASIQYNRILCPAVPRRKIWNLHMSSSVPRKDLASCKSTDEPKMSIKQLFMGHWRKLFRSRWLTKGQLPFFLRVYHGLRWSRGP